MQRLVIALGLTLRSLLKQHGLWHLQLWSTHEFRTMCLRENIQNIREGPYAGSSMQIMFAHILDM
jgi:hypothetical protein